MNNCKLHKNKLILAFILGILCSFGVFAQSEVQEVYPQENQDYLITKDDIRLVKDTEAGYHLFIKKKPKINSVILVETTKDPLGQAENYAYRATTFNSINGNEKRILNGEFLTSEYAKFSLIDSTPEKDEQFGEAFHIYIPEKLVFGYPWSRNGEINIEKGTFINIRTFEKPYADYTGEWKDNSFMFNFTVVKKPLPPSEPEPEPLPEPEPKMILTDSYNPKASFVFEKIANSSKGLFKYSEGPDTIVEDFMESFLAINPKDKIDLVVCIDATGSMKDDIEILKRNLIPTLQKELQNCGDVRLGLILYRDYIDSFRHKGLPLKLYDFVDNLDDFMKPVNQLKITGLEGGDVPEAVYEALYGAIQYYDWDVNAQKKIILIGDAEPHPSPRGTTIKCTFELVDSLAKQKNILIDTIITPDK